MQTPSPSGRRAELSPDSRSAVIVLGGHRCGTSSIAGAIAHLGIPAALPGREIGVSPSNPRGHFEDAILCRLHEQMLGRGGWRDPSPAFQVPPELLAEYDSHLRSRAAAAARFCIKDPRLCLLLPVLVDRLRSQHIRVSVVIVTRSPSAAASSLQCRDRLRRDAALRIAWLYEGARRAQQSWLAHQKIPLLTVDYDEVLDDRVRTVGSLAAFLRVPPTDAAIAFLEPALRHQ